MKTSNTSFVSNKLLLGIILFTLVSYQTFAISYYVSNNGNDSNTGTSVATAWKTISKVNAKALNPGDSVLFERGGIWREELYILNKSGSAGKYIFFGAYGTGNKPRILGSVKAVNWTQTSKPNVWQASGIPENPMAIGWFSELFIEVTSDSVAWGDYKTYDTAFSQLTKELNWCWNNGTVYCYSPADPDTRYKSYEVPQRKWGISIDRSEYLAFDNLAVHYTVEVGIGAVRPPTKGNSFNGLRITNCLISHIGAKNGPYDYGIESLHSNVYIANNEIHNSGRRNISLTTYRDYDSIVIRNVVVENNYLHHGWHTTGVDLNTTGSHLVDSVIIRNNLIEGETYNFSDGVPTNGVFVANQSGDLPGVIRNVYVYNNIITHSRGKAVILENVKDCYVVNNTIYGVNPTTDAWQVLISTISENPQANYNIFNNIIYNDEPAAAPSFYAFLCDYENIYQPKMDYNLWWGTRADTWMWEGFDRSNNGLKVWEYTLQGYTAFKGRYSAYEVHSPSPADPQFVDPLKGDFKLKSTSPAIGKALPFKWITHDYYGEKRDASNPCIGAVEFKTVNSINRAMDEDEFGIIYPNPATDIVFVKTMPDCLITVLNMHGQVIHRQNSSNDITQLNHAFPKGVYVVQVMRSNELLVSNHLVVK